jgi:hypothetical protein
VTTTTNVCVLIIPFFIFLKGRANLEDLEVRLEDNIKMVLKEIDWEGVDWNYIVQGRKKWQAVVKAVTNLRVPHNSWNFLTG